MPAIGKELRERLFTAGAEALQDYELLEFLLFATIPHRDVKPLAKELLVEFRAIFGVCSMPGRND